MSIHNAFDIVRKIITLVAWGANLFVHSPGLTETSVMVFYFTLRYGFTKSLINEANRKTPPNDIYRKNTSQM